MKDYTLAEKAVAFVTLLQFRMKAAYDLDDEPWEALCGAVQYWELEISRDVLQLYPATVITGDD